MKPGDRANKSTEGKGDSRRWLMRRSSKAMAGLLLGSMGAPLTRFFPGEHFWTRWYDVVQDMKDGRKWHVNLFAAPRLGDVERARHLSYRMIEAFDVDLIKEKLKYPVRVQFRDGHKEQNF